MSDKSEAAIQVINISDEEIRVYKDHARPPTLRRAMRQLEKIAQDRKVLLDMGEDEAVAGATAELLHALLDVLAVPLASFADQEAKAHAMAKFFHLCNPAWLLEHMMGVATCLAIQLLDFTPEQVSRLRELSPFSRVPA